MNVCSHCCVCLCVCACVNGGRCWHPSHAPRSALLPWRHLTACAAETPKGPSVGALDWPATIAPLNRKRATMHDDKHAMHADRQTIHADEHLFNPYGACQASEQCEVEQGQLAPLGRAVAPPHDQIAAIKGSARNSMLAPRGLQECQRKYACSATHPTFMSRTPEGRNLVGRYTCRGRQTPTHGQVVSTGGAGGQCPTHFGTCGRSCRS